MEIEAWVNTGSSNGLFPDSTKALSDVDFSLVRFCGIQLRIISQQVP